MDGWSPDGGEWFSHFCSPHGPCSESLGSENPVSVRHHVPMTLPCDSCVFVSLYFTCFCVHPHPQTQQAVGERAKKIRRH